MGCLACIAKPPGGAGEAPPDLDAGRKWLAAFKKQQSSRPKELSIRASFYGEEAKAGLLQPHLEHRRSGERRLRS